MSQDKRTLLNRAAAVLSKLRDYHDDNGCDTCCEDSVEANRVIELIEEANREA